MGDRAEDVVVSAPRRYGKVLSLVWAATSLVAKDGEQTQVDLMTTPTKERLAAALAASIYENIASPLERVWDKAAAKPRLRLQPSISLEPETGAVAFNFAGAREPADVDATIEELLEPPAAIGAERGRRPISSSTSSRRWSIVTTSWNSSKISATRRSRAAPSSRRQGEQALERRVDVSLLSARREGEAERAIARINRDRRLDAQAAERRQGLLPRPLRRRADVLVDRRGELCGELLLGRGQQQVDVGDQHPLADQVLHRPQTSEDFP